GVTDSSGSRTSNNGAGAPVVAGTSSALEMLEPSFHQDLNGDGVIGLAVMSGGTVEVSSAYSGPATFMGSSGILQLDQSASFSGTVAGMTGQDTLDLRDISFATIRSPTYSGTSTGGTLSVSDGTHNAQIALLGNYLASVFVASSDGHGGTNVVGLPKTVIESAGSTSLVQLGNNYFLYPVGGSSGPELSYFGAPVVAGQFGSWTPLGAGQTASGYEVAWKVTGADQYSVWTTDSSGSYISNNGAGAPVVTGTSSALEMLEPSFHQDLNGDGVIGLAVMSGGTVEVSSAYSGPATFMGSSGILQLDQSASFSGTVAGMTGQDTLDLRDISFATIRSPTYSGTSTGGTLSVSDGTHNAQIALLGNYLASVFVASSDGHGGTNVVGLPKTGIEAPGATRLVQLGNNYFLYPVGGSSGPELSYFGAPVVAGQFGSWTPLGAEQTASGYEVAWKVTGADQYSVWTTDSSGSYISNNGAGAPVVTGTSSALEMLEPSFHQDLNGDGVIGLAVMSGGTVEVSSAYSGPATFMGSSGILQLDQSASFSGTVAGMTGQDTLDLRDISFATIRSPTYSGTSTGGTLSVSDGTHNAQIALLGNYLASVFVASSDGHGGTNVVGLPKTVIESAGSTSLVQLGNNYFLYPVGGSSGPELSY